MISIKPPSPSSWRLIFKKKKNKNNQLISFTQWFLNWATSHLANGRVLLGSTWIPMSESALIPSLFSRFCHSLNPANFSSYVPLNSVSSISPNAGVVQALHSLDNHLSLGLQGLRFYRPPIHFPPPCPSNLLRIQIWPSCSSVDSTYPIG